MSSNSPLQLTPPKRLVAVGAVESAGGAHQVLVVDNARAPYRELVTGVEADGQVIGGEAAILIDFGCVGQG